MLWIYCGGKPELKLDKKLVLVAFWLISFSVNLTNEGGTKGAIVNKKK